MNLFSLTFLVFFLVVLFGISRTRTARQQNVWLLAASVVFYGYWDWRFLLLLMGVTLTVYVAAQRVRTSRVALWVGIGLPLLSLGICKYLDFFIDSFCAAFGIAHTGSLGIILPLGISFYTFLALSYLLDVYHEKIPAEESILTVALYVAFFPTIVSGPITKARDLLPELKRHHPFAWANVRAGVQIFTVGCIKKFVVADHLGILVDEVYKTPLAFDSATVWLAVLAYSLQLYLDFAGYSDMAIGCGRMLGIRLAENFNLPYLSRNVSEFWKRWHMSLSSWLMEYFYFTIGGSRCATWKIYRNLFLTMLVCGLWHGAAWNFVLWGGIWGLLLCWHRWYRTHIGASIHIPVAGNMLITFLTVTLAWVFFRGTDITNIYEIFYRLFVWEGFGVHHMLLYAWIALPGLLLIQLRSYHRLGGNGWTPHLDIAQPKGFFLLCLAFLFIWCFMYTGNNPFVYAAF